VGVGVGVELEVCVWSVGSECGCVNNFKEPLNRADGRARTADQLITNQLLYQLSYIGEEGAGVSVGVMEVCVFYGFANPNSDAIYL
jgi:hypothetical protein